MLKTFRATTSAMVLALALCVGAAPCLAFDYTPPENQPDFRQDALRLIDAGCYDDYLSDRVGEFAADYPETFAFAGEDRVRLFIAMSLAKGLHYNLFAGREIGSLRAMMLILGSGFDADPLYPWARFPVFPPKDPDEENPESWVHMCNVWKRFVIFHRNSVGYSNGEYTWKAAYNALMRTIKLRFEDLANLDPEAVVTLMARIYPERYAQLPGRTVLLDRLMKLAEQKAAQHGMPTRAGRNLFAGIFFYCGSSADENPLYEPLFEGLDAFPRHGFARERELFGRLMHYLEEDAGR